MGGLVEKVSNQAITALQERDTELSAGVHELDLTIDQQEVKIVRRVPEDSRPAPARGHGSSLCGLYHEGQQRSGANGRSRHQHRRESQLPLQP